MSRKKIVAGNWKMNTNANEAIELIEKVKSNSKNFLQVEKIIFPPFPFLKTSIDSLINESNFFVGAQNCSEHVKGAYTGEVSAEMLNSVGCKFVLVGHSERRHFFNENDGQHILKIQQLIKIMYKLIIFSFFKNFLRIFILKTKIKIQHNNN